MLVDRPVSIRFAGTDAAGNPAPIYVRRLYLDFYQPNYELKEHLINPADQARQDALASLQTALPFSDRPVQGAVPVSLVGAQYEIGLRDIAGERYNPAGPGVFVSGPFHLDGMPEIFRLDVDITGQVDCYLYCRPLWSWPGKRCDSSATGTWYCAAISRSLVSPGHSHQRRFLSEVGIPQR